MDTADGILGTNMYAYCHNDPINYYDPDGFRKASIKKVPAGAQKMPMQRMLGNQTPQQFKANHRFNRTLSTKPDGRVFQVVSVDGFKARGPAAPIMGPINPNMPALQQKALEDIIDWLGPNATMRPKKIDDRDIVFMSADETRKFRMDLFHTHGQAPHVHFEILVNRDWVDAFPGVHQIFIRQ